MSTSQGIELHMLRPRSSVFSQRQLPTKRANFRPFHLCCRTCGLPCLIINIFFSLTLLVTSLYLLEFFVPSLEIVPFDHLEFPYYLVIVAIFRNEAPYLPEWLEYHLVVGVEKFFLFDNDSDDGPESVLCPYIRDGLVNYTKWSGKAQQLPVYNFALLKLRPVAFWVAFVDIDEFIIPVSRPTVSELLREFKNFSSITVYWMVYGSGGQLNKTEGLVTERFVDHLVKSIVNPRYSSRMEVHEAWAISQFGRACRPQQNSLHGVVKGAFRRPKTGLSLSVNQSLLDKVVRGMAHKKSTRKDAIKRNREGGTLYGVRIQ
jgi:hypothetical protein